VAEAVRQLEMAAAVEATGAALGTVLAARLAGAEGWSEHGEPSAAHALAGVTGTSVAAAEAELLAELAGGAPVGTGGDPPRLAEWQAVQGRGELDRHRCCSKSTSPAVCWRTCHGIRWGGYRRGEGL
jgi:hypothetical protein